MNIRQLHDELRSGRGRRYVNLAGDCVFIITEAGVIATGAGHTNKLCTLSDLERDDWTVTRSKLDPHS